MSRPARTLRVVALALVALLLPFAVVLAYLTTDPVFSYAVNLYLFDLPLAVLVIPTIPLLAARLRARRLAVGAALWTALGALVLLSFAWHPSLEGAQTLWRVLGALAIAVTFAELGPAERRVVVGALAAGALAQSAWAAAQVLNEGPLGAWWLFESQKPLARSGDALIPKGTMQTPYLLAALAMLSSLLLVRQGVTPQGVTRQGVHGGVGARAIAWCAAIAALVVPVGITYSRAALAGLAAAAVALVPRARTDPLRRAAILALAIGVAVPAALTASGWLTRGEQLGEVRPDSGRGILLLQGLRVFATEPLTGVGPGRYMAGVRALADDPAVRVGLLPTHSVPLLVAAESGVLAGAAVLVLLGALLVRAARDRDDVAIATCAVLLPFWLLDALPYSLPQGVILSGLWLGALDAAHGDVPALDATHRERAA